MLLLMIKCVVDSSDNSDDVGGLYTYALASSFGHTVYFIFVWHNFS